MLPLVSLEVLADPLGLGGLAANMVWVNMRDCGVTHIAALLQRSGQSIPCINPKPPRNPKLLQRNEPLKP